MRKAYIDKDYRQNSLMMWSDFLHKMLWNVLGKHFAAGTYAARLMKNLSLHCFALQRICGTLLQLFFLAQKSMMDQMSLQDFMRLKSGGL